MKNFTFYVLLFLGSLLQAQFSPIMVCKADGSNKRFFKILQTHQKITMKRILLLSLFLSLSFNAQEKPLVCGFDEFQNLTNNEISKETEKFIQEFRKRIPQNQSVLRKSLKTKSELEISEIPVVVHVIVPSGAAIGTTNNPSDEAIEKWLEDVNMMYAGTYPWTSAPADFGEQGVIPVKLVLAKRKSDCTATTGIVRYDASGLSGYNTFGMSYQSSGGPTRTTIKNIAPHWPEESYYNIYVVNKIDNGSGIGGFAGLPSNGDSAYEAFMAGIPSNVLAHEFGHAMGLLHTFGSASNPPDGNTSTSYCPTDTGVCTSDNDGVCDTERSTSLLNESPVPTNSQINICTGVNYQSVQYNMMNYTKSQARKFTVGQSERSNLYFSAYRGTLKSSLGGTAPNTVSTTVQKAISCSPTLYPYNSLHFVGPTYVKLGSINNSTLGLVGSNSDTEHYHDYTVENCLKATSTEISSTQESEIEIQFILNKQSVRVWIDYDNSGSFESNELVASGDQINIEEGGFQGTFKAKFTPPSTAVLNTPLRMRVLSDYTNETEISPCGQLQYGQAEDYTVTLVNTLRTDDILKAKDKIKFYYNQQYNKLVILHNLGSVDNYEIFDATGKLIQKGNSKSYEIQIKRTLNKGIYIVNVGSNGNIIQTKFMVK
ncbi:GEVED domain-containing protein [Daejeonia sp. YH14]|uniref:GEVED domain-containing protein n=1 Tax=Daejeonia sp. YH14 TaxID=3439042 RepID=UPI003F4989E9